jgi:opacity protein-like surface antigen
MIRTTVVGILLCLLVVTAPVLAQDEARAELFGGYQWLRASTGAPVSGIDHFSLNGWNASFSGFFNRYLGVTGDFSGTYGTPSVDVPLLGRIGVDTHLYTYMVGPVVRAPNDGPIQPFAHVLFGAAYVGGSAGIPVFGGLSVGDTDTGFAWAAGGGVDFKVSPRFAIRAAQFDFLQTHIGGDSQNNIRYSGGIVFRF